MSRSSHIQDRDITIDSNWIITIGMALLFAFVALLLGWSIRNFLYDRFDNGSLQPASNGWLDRLIYILGAIYCFVFAYSFHAKHLKAAFLLLGTKYAALVALFYVHVSLGAQHSIVVAGWIACQIAYTIILVAIVHWFKTVVRRAPPSHPEIGSS